MSEFIKLCLLVCPLVFLGGFVDSIAGGGGLITIPAYLMAGLPTHIVLGTNKVVASTGTATAAVRYFKSGKIKMRIALISALGAIVGSAIGSKIALLIPEDILKILMLVALPVISVILMVKKDLGRDTAAEKTYSSSYETAVSSLIGLVIGLYDGLIGPGTGTFMIMAFSALLSLDLITASGCAKVSNLASTAASAVVFMFNGNVYWALVIPAALCNALGGYCGSLYAIRGGSSKVRGTIFIVLGMMFIKMFWELIA